jgi:hypothetical protein
LAHFSLLVKWVRIRLKIWQDGSEFKKHHIFVKVMSCKLPHVPTANSLMSHPPHHMIHMPSSSIATATFLSSSLLVEVSFRVNLTTIPYKLIVWITRNLNSLTKRIARCEAHLFRVTYDAGLQTCHFYETTRTKTNFKKSKFRFTFFSSTIGLPNKSYHHDFDCWYAYW